MIKDSGSRTEFKTGAVRDIQSLEKGRCDLMPLDVIGEIMNPVENPLHCINEFQQDGDFLHLYDALRFCGVFPDLQTMFLETAIHMAEGCQKYGERNWQKGIPISRYIDSAVRHYCKLMRGDTDERHDRAFCWNLICACWTCKHKPELNDYLGAS